MSAAYPPLPSGRFGVIYADPPWTYVTRSAKGKGRSAEAWYDCLSLDVIKALPVADVAAPDAVLLLWTTDPLLRHALDVVGAWGFTYKTTGFVWAKARRREVPIGGAAVLDLADPRLWFMGTGFWTRANPELCLLATRGAPRRLAADVRKLVVAPKREHSRKPDEVYGLIERLVPGPYIELFSRSSRPGWINWGTEAGLLDAGGRPARRWASNGYPGAAE